MGGGRGGDVKTNAAGDAMKALTTSINHLGLELGWGCVVRGGVRGGIAGRSLRCGVCGAWSVGCVECGLWAWIVGRGVCGV